MGTDNTSSRAKHALLLKRMRDKGEHREHGGEVIRVLPAPQRASGGSSLYVFVRRGKNRCHIHDHTNSRVRVLVGTGTCTINGKKMSYRPGSQFEFPAGIPHGFTRVVTNTLFVSTHDHPIQNAQTLEVDIRYPDEV